MKINKNKEMKASLIVCFALIAIQSVYCPPPIKTSTQSSATTKLDTANPTTTTTTKIETFSIETTTFTTPISNGAGGGTITPPQFTIASTITLSLSSIFYALIKLLF